MKRDNWVKGLVGQKAAIEFLQKDGFRILATNFRSRFGEIDIVTEKDDIVVFVEVKTKTGDAFGEPWEMVNQHKLGQIRMMGEVFLTKNGLNDRSCRIDVIGVWLNRDSEVTKLEHWDNVDN